MSVIAKKICLVGDFAVGKTSLIRRFVDRQFSDQYLTTVGVKISRKMVEVKATAQQETSQSVQLIIWDLEGQTQFKAIAPTYLQGSHGSIIVADVTRPETIEHISEHIKLFSQVNPQGLIIIAYNKVDLISEQKLNKLIQQYNYINDSAIISHYSTSAKTGIYVDEMFERIATQMI